MLRSEFDPMELLDDVHKTREMHLNRPGSRVVAYDQHEVAVFSRKGRTRRLMYRAEKKRYSSLCFDRDGKLWGVEFFSGRLFAVDRGWRALCSIEDMEVNLSTRG